MVFFMVSVYTPAKTALKIQEFWGSFIIEWEWPALTGNVWHWLATTGMSVTQEAGLIYICWPVESHGDYLFSDGCGV